MIPWSEPIEWAEPSEQELVLIVLRHGETDANVSRVASGSRDVSINEKGREQASRVAAKIRDLQKEGKLKISGLYSSHMRRAVETANHFSQELDLPLEQRADLREIFWGDAEGVTWEFARKEWGEIVKRIREEFSDRKMRWDYLPPYPNAERYNQVHQRVIGQFQSIADEHWGEVVLVVSHGVVIRNLIAEALDKYDEEIEHPRNCEAVVFRYSVDGSLQFVEIRENR